MVLSYTYSLGGKEVKETKEHTDTDGYYSLNELVQDIDPLHCSDEQLAGFWKHQHYDTVGDDCKTQDVAILERLIQILVQ